jgi:formylmethanofuran dehydrogenase subunit B
LSSHSLVCTGCGCLCDDIQVETEGSRLVSIENACAKGTALLRSAADPGRRAGSLVGGRSAPVDEAIEEATRLLSKASRPVIFGLDDSTTETQVAAVELARKLGAVIDDASSFSFGSLTEGILDGSLPTCSVAEVKDNADLLVYWGSNPPHTHPRHISKFTYYAYADYDPAGWYPKVTLSCVDVRETELYSMSRKTFKVKPGGDSDFIKAVLGEAQDETGDAASFLEMVEKADFCAVFPGAGLVCSLDDDLACFEKMVHMLGESTRMAVVPMIAESNMLGFNGSLREKTGHVNKVSFAAGVSHGSEFSFLEQVRNGTPDCVLIVGSDPFSVLPQSLMRNLEGASVICLERFSTATTGAADVVIPTALPGFEQGGSVVRMDGERLALAGAMEGDFPSEASILERLAEGTG